MVASQFFDGFWVNLMIWIILAGKFVNLLRGANFLVKK